MYVAVEFAAPAQEMLVLPRKAIHQGRVYIARENNELEIREVNLLHKQGELVVIDQGIEEGEKIIITDVIPVIEGLPLKPIQASKYEAQLAQAALGSKRNALKDKGAATRESQPVEQDHSKGAAK
jgi:hypothetical protein